jgi:hypothetical protein
MRSVRRGGGDGMRRSSLFDGVINAAYPRENVRRSRLPQRRLARIRHIRRNTNVSGISLGFIVVLSLCPVA